MNHKILPLMLLIFSSGFAQPKRDFKEFDKEGLADKFIYYETNIFPSDSLSPVYFSYRIPYNRLVFEKDKDNYLAALRFSIEVTDTNSKFIKREIVEKKISVEEFEKTNSNELFSEGVIEFHLQKGEYFLLPIFSDLNSESETRLEKIRIGTEPGNKKESLSTIIINPELFECEGETFRTLANYEGKIPFSGENYDILIPVKDTLQENIYITVVNIKDTVFSGFTEESLSQNISLKECGGKVVLGNEGSSFIKYLVLNNISNKLKEGNILINISEGKDSKPGYTFKTQVKWYGKPRSLIYPEQAIADLKYIEADSTINNLLDENKLDYHFSLFNYWKKYDPTPETEYNELMNEYYTRIDYAQSNFSGISGKNGADTDRGKIYIKFGNPQKIERTSNEYGKIVETWTYENPQRKFVFVDQNGIGEFSLQNG